MHFEEFESKLEKCKGVSSCMLMNFDSKLEKCEGVSLWILMNFDIYILVNIGEFWLEIRKM